MDLRKLKTLIDLVAESSIAELEVTEGESKVRIVKSGASPAHSQVVMMPAHPASMPAAAPMAAPASAPAAPLAAPEQPSGHVVKSPMVGTFYAAASPTATAIEIAMQRSPAEPYAEPISACAASCGSASGITTM